MTCTTTRYLISHVICRALTLYTDIILSDFDRTPQNRSQWTQALMSRGNCIEAWGYTALLELHHEARQRGLVYETLAHEVEMQRVLERWGFDVLCERFPRFMSPEDRQLMEELFSDLAREMLDKYHQILSYLNPA